MSQDGFTKVNNYEIKDEEDDDSFDSDFDYSDESDEELVNAHHHKSNTPKKKHCLRRICDLPLCIYCQRWRCCFWCRPKKAFKSLEADNTENRNKTTTEKAEEALVYEECLDATTTKLVEQNGWVNATMFSLALSTTIYIDFPDDSDEAKICKNAWIYFVVIFCLSITSLFIPKCCEKTDSLRQELKIKKEEKLY